MKFAGISLIASDLQGLYAFYHALLQEDGQWEGTEHVSFPQAGIVLFSVQGMEQLAPGFMQSCGTGKTVLSFDVDDVDSLLATPALSSASIIKSPQNHPWGLRSAWLKDPEGNIISFRSPVR